MAQISKLFMAVWPEHSAWLVHAQFHSNIADIDTKHFNMSLVEMQLNMAYHNRDTITGGSSSAL
jgi:hypothetical protein